MNEDLLTKIYIDAKEYLGIWWVVRIALGALFLVVFYFIIGWLIKRIKYEFKLGNKYLREAFGDVERAMGAKDSLISTMEKDKAIRDAKIKDLSEKINEISNSAESAISQRDDALRLARATISLYENNEEELKNFIYEQIEYIRRLWTSKIQMFFSLDDASFYLIPKFADIENRVMNNMSYSEVKQFLNEFTGGGGKYERKKAAIKLLEARGQKEDKQSNQAE